MSLYPDPAAKTEPKRLKAIFATPNKKEVSNKKKDSIAKVEYVVSAPKKPVVKKDLVSPEKLYTANKAKRTPIRNEPIIFTVKIPYGKSLTKVLLQK